MNIVKKLIPALGILALSTLMVGQATPAAAAGVDVDVAYQYLHISSGGSGESAPAGFAAGITLPLASPWSVVGDFGWNRKSDGDAKFTPMSIGGGLRYTPASMAQVRPYLQAVAGLEMDKSSVSVLGSSVSNTETNFMLQPGVGGMFGLGNLHAFVEGDYRWVHATGGSANDLVLRAGIIFNLGK